MIEKLAKRFVCYLILISMCGQVNGNFRKPILVTISSQPFAPKHHLASESCGDAKEKIDNCIRDLLLNSMGLLKSIKVSGCDVFRRGMTCFETYAIRCLTKQKQAFINDNLDGVRRVFTKFCYDSEFQRKKRKEDDQNKNTKETDNLAGKLLSAELPTQAKTELMYLSIVFIIFSTIYFCLMCLLCVT